MNVFIFLLYLIPSIFGDSPPHPLSDDYVDWLNSQLTTWEASEFPNKELLESYVYSWKGSHFETEELIEKRRKVHDIPDDVVVPEFFDAREQWPECESIGRVVDQGACGSCYVVAPTSAMTDRICIHSGGKIKQTVSVMNALSCTYYGFGCGGGFPYQTWDWWNLYGLVTGGWYNNFTEGCQSYGYAPCDHPGNTTDCPYPACNPTTVDPVCSYFCDEGTNLIYENEKTYGQEFYYPGYPQEDIQYEIMTNGPVSANIELFADLFFYKKGVYQKAPNSTSVGGHSVKIIGWGVENDVPYWLVVNSFNEYWGDKGFFKILRGEDECRIETYIIGAIPKFDRI